jgi:poly-gamma-glutamate capsule biosynthesis protein CapA/YwtB (metallophosphatase superfamily)
MKILVHVLTPVLVLIAFAAFAEPFEDITIAAVGDIMLGGRAEPFIRDFGPGYPFGDVGPLLKKADVVVGNLEAPISERGEAVKNKKFTLRAGPAAASVLKTGGFSVVSLANNHSMDFGPAALQDTIAALSDAGILYTGAGMTLDEARTPALLRIKGKTLAFLSYSLTFPLDFFASEGRPGVAPGYADYVKADIQKVRRRADLVVVSFHWGAELMTAAKDYQIELGRQAIDWGADLVLGHHPHVLQELELRRGRLIAYSLGNFIFGSESNNTNTGLLLLLSFRGNALGRVEAAPLDVNNYRVKYRPRVLVGKAAEEALRAVNAASERFGTRLDIAEGIGVIELGTTETTTAALNAPGPGSSPRTSFSLSAP